MRFWDYEVLLVCWYNEGYVGRDSYLDTEMSILENRPTEVEKGISYDYRTQRTKF